MIYLSALDRCAYGEETFWVWFEKKFENSRFGLPDTLTKNDVVLRYSLMGPLNTYPAKQILLCWELLPELKEVFNVNDWDRKIELSYEAAKVADHLVVASRFNIPYYEKYAKSGKIDILPIGVDTDLFRPYSPEEKLQLKIKYNVPLDKEIGFWCGTTHPMKGIQNVQRYANENPNIYWIIVWYPHRGSFSGYGQQHVMVTQPKMAELMNLADFQISASMLKPYYIIQYEGMACNLKQRKIVNLEKDFEVGDNPRESIFKHKWDRPSTKIVWEEYIDKVLNS